MCWEFWTNLTRAIGWAVAGGVLLYTARHIAGRRARRSISIGSYGCVFFFLTLLIRAFSCDPETARALWIWHMEILTSAGEGCILFMAINIALRIRNAEKQKPVLVADMTNRFQEILSLSRMGGSG